MTKSAARKLKKKCIRLAYKFVDENKAAVLANRLFSLIRRETKTGGYL